MADLNDFNLPTPANNRVDVQDTQRANTIRAMTQNPGSAGSRPIGAKLSELISNVFTFKNWNGSGYDTWLTISNFMRGLLDDVDGQAARDTLLVPSRAQIVAQTYTAFTTGGTGFAYTLTPTPAITSYAVGQSFFVTFHVQSQTNPTLTISGLGTALSLVCQTGAGTYVPIPIYALQDGDRYRVTVISGTQALVEGLVSRNWFNEMTAAFTSNSATMNTGGYSIVVCPNASGDMASSYNTSTGIWTCPQTGIYSFEYDLVISSATWSSNGVQLTAYIAVNGVVGLDQYYIHATSPYERPLLSGSGIRFMYAGQTAYLAGFNGTGSVRTFVGGADDFAERTRLKIKRIG